MVMEIIIKSVFIGVFATAVIDLWALLLKKGFGLPTTNWAMVGRWFGHLPRGVFVHNPITESDAVAHEHLIGWVAHYVVGILYALLYFFVVVDVLSTTPTLLSAVVFGLLTLLVPAFILQPGLGLGVFARHAPQPGVTRLISLSLHVIFGVSLFWGWMVTRYFLSVW